MRHAMNVNLCESILYLCEESKFQAEQVNEYQSLPIL